jgi:hypothetical protein
VDIDFSSNSGATWSAIADSIVSTGTYVWSNIPNANSEQCRIRVRDAVDGFPSDMSDANFAIVQAKQIRVTFPNLSTHTITTDTAFAWYSAGVAKVKLEINLDNGATGWRLLDSNVNSTGAWTFSFTAFPWVVSTQARIKITDMADSTISDVSDQLFSIYPLKAGTIGAIMPNGTIGGKPAFKIFWNSFDVGKSSTLEYSGDQGLNWKSLAQSEGGNFQNETVLICEEPVNNCLIRVVEESGKSRSKPIPLQ